MHLGFWTIRSLICLLVCATVSNSAHGFVQTEASDGAANSATGAVQAPIQANLAPFGLPDLRLFLRAGRPIPPGLTATRMRERTRERDSALQRLSSEFGIGSATQESWTAAFR